MNERRGESQRYYSFLRSNEKRYKSNQPIVNSIMKETTLPDIDLVKINRVKCS